MTWPLSQDYNEAIQTPDMNFADPELRRGEIVTNALGLPRPCSGNFADVYQVRCPSSGNSWAVKCFTREVRSLRERYQAISSFLTRANLPFMVNFNYLDEGIRVQGRWFPIVKMQWVEGYTLNSFVGDNLDKPATLDSLSRIWVRMVVALRQANFAHGDLQHGNVLLIPAARQRALAVKLIDYDGMFLPALAHLRSSEYGHGAYQHPLRGRERAYNVGIDRFPALVVVTALRALAVVGKSLWERYDNADNLLFREKDFQNPAASPLFRELLNLGDALTWRLTYQLMLACAKPLAQTVLVEELVEGSEPARPTAEAPADRKPVLTAPAFASPTLNAYPFAEPVTLSPEEVIPLPAGNPSRGGSWLPVPVSPDTVLPFAEPVPVARDAVHPFAEPVTVSPEEVIPLGPSPALSGTNVEGSRNNGPLVVSDWAAQPPPVRGVSADAGALADVIPITQPPRRKFRLVYPLRLRTLRQRLIAISMCMVLGILIAILCLAGGGCQQSGRSISSTDLQRKPQ